MFLHRAEIDPKSSSLPVHPADLHEWPERNLAAYAWFWVLLAIAILAMILIGIRIWLYNRQQHEGGCPCRKCKPHHKKRIPIELQPIGRELSNKRIPPTGLLSIHEEEVEVLVESPQEGSSEEPRSSSSSPPSPPLPGFKLNGDGDENNPGKRNSSRRNSLPPNLKNLYNQTKIGFEGLFHYKKENYDVTPSTASP